MSATATLFQSAQETELEADPVDKGIDIMETVQNLFRTGQKDNFERAADVRVQLTEGKRMWDRLSSADKQEIERMMDAFYAVPGGSYIMLVFPNGTTEKEPLLSSERSGEEYLEEFSRRILRGRLARMAAQYGGKLIFINYQDGDAWQYTVVKLNGLTWRSSDKAEGFRVLVQYGIETPGTYFTLDELQKTV